MDTEQLCHPASCGATGLVGPGAGGPEPAAASLQIQCDGVAPVHEWKRISGQHEQELWRTEVCSYPSLSTYARVKLRLELEGYLCDGPGAITLGSRRSIMDMVRLRCGSHDLAISAARRQWSSAAGDWPGRARQTGPVPREERVCIWCAERLALPHMQSLAAGRRVPMETEEHALLWCGLYAAARRQFFQHIRQLTDRRMRRAATCSSRGRWTWSSSSCRARLTAVVRTRRWPSCWAACAVRHPQRLDGLGRNRRSTASCSRRARRSSARLYGNVESGTGRRRAAAVVCVSRRHWTNGCVQRLQYQGHRSVLYDKHGHGTVTVEQRNVAGVLRVMQVGELWCSLVLDGRAPRKGSAGREPGVDGPCRMRSCCSGCRNGHK